MFIVIFVFMLMLLAAIFVYTGLRGLRFLSLFVPKANKIIWWIGFAFIPLLLIIFAFIDLPYTAKAFFTKASYIYLSIILFLFLFTFLQDIIWLIVTLAGRFRQREGSMWKRAGRIRGFGVLLVATVFLIYGFINANIIRTTEYDITVGKKAGNIENLRIAMFSDSHIGYQLGADRMERIVDSLNASQPDIILIAGDVFDSSVFAVEDTDALVRALSRLESRYGVFCCLGNHDYHSYDTIELLERAGVTVLLDEIVDLGEFYVAGRRDFSPIYSDSERLPLSEIIEKDANFDSSKPLILLEHQPYTIDESVENGVDIMLSGHTHKGQVFPANIVTRFLYEQDYGAGVYGDGMNLVVSSGAGYWGPPLRVGSKSEVVVIEVAFEK